MYSNTNNNISSQSTVYPFPPYNFPLSSSPSSYNNHHPLLHQEIVTCGGIYGLPHNDQSFPLLNNTFMAPGPESTMLNQGGASSNTVISSCGDYQQLHYGYGPNVCHPHIISKQVKVPVVAVKKDRHSKIYTAQGLRDRRVRLSINVAREFFDLQDLLGFDKASKTVEWLLNKARKDIIDLGKSKSINATFECNGVQADINNKVSKEKRKRKEAAAAARELRSKARERARQRTREKTCSNSKKSSPQMFTQLNLFNELEPADINKVPGSTLLSIYQVQERQSVAVKRKFKAPSASNYQDRNPGLISGSRETCSDRCGHISIQFPSAISQNWDMTGGNFTCPSIYAINTNIPT